MTKAVLGMLCYDKPSVLEIRISQIKAKLSLLLLTWSLAKPRTESTQTLGHAKTLMCRVRKACPAPLWNVFFFVCQKLAVYNSSHNSICVDCDRLIKLSFLHWQRGTRDDVGGIIWINRLSKLMTGEKLKRKGEEEEKALTVKASTIVFAFCGCNRWERKQSYRDRKWI